MSAISSAKRVASHRAKMRGQGMRLLQIWVPDTQAPGFAEEARRQSRAVSEAHDFDDWMDFIERHAVIFDDDEDGSMPDAAR